MSANPLVVRTADLSKAKPPRWAWLNRFAIAYLCLLIGEEDIGKSTLIAWCIAQWTKGLLQGSFYGKPIDVGILGDEDSFDDLWTPRLHAAGADLSRVHLIERGDGNYVDLGRDRKYLTERIREHKIKVLFLDALLDNLPPGVDVNDQKSVRDALRPFRTFARHRRIAVIGSLHPNKKASTPRQLVANSVAFRAVARSVMYLLKEPDDPGRVVFLRGKGNLSTAPQARTFAIETAEFTAHGEKFSVSRVCKIKRSEWRIQDLMDATDSKRVKPESKQDSCRALVSHLLPRDGEWHPCGPIYEACRGADLNDRTINRAKLDLFIQHRSIGSPPVVEWKW